MTPSMDALTALQTRTASPKLTDPAPTAAELEQVLKAGLRAPDHAKLRPWRFLVVSGEGRERLGQLLVDARAPETDAERDSLRATMLRAPLIIVAIAKMKEHPNVPRLEQVASTAAAVQNMAVALHALGYASVWRTGPTASDPRVKAALGLDAHDEIVSYLYVGTPVVPDRPAPEHALSDFVEFWS